MKKMLPYLTLATWAVVIWVYSQEKVSPSPVLVNAKTLANLTVVESPREIEELNRRNRNVKSLTCFVDLDVTGIPISVESRLWYRKPNDFRMLTSSILGRESDVGCNDDFLWYWSKRASSPCLHYARRVDLHKTMLKPALNPEWLTELLGFDEIDISEVERFGRFEDKIVVFEPRTDTIGRDVTKVTLIAEGNAIGHYLFGPDGRMEVSAEVLSFQKIDGFDCPERILVIWQSEGLVVEWGFRECEINRSQENGIFETPDRTNGIDIGS